MGFFQFISDSAYNAAWELEKLSRNYGQLDLKMEIFLSSYKGKVLDACIPSISYVGGTKEPSGLFVSCYVRLVFGNGVTRFDWFHDFDAANKYAAEQEKAPDVVKVIGPYNLPKGKNDRFY